MKLSRESKIGKELSGKEGAGTASHKKRNLFISLLVIALVIILVLVYLVRTNEEATADADIAYKEETVTYGSLMVGISEDGNVAIGTTTQTLDVDISEFTGDEDTSFSWGGGGGGMGMGGQTTTTSSSSSDSTTRELIVKEVYASIGQEISEGDPIALLDEDSVNEILAELQSDVTDAQNTYDQTATEQTISDQTVDQNYSLYQEYSDYAQTEYDTTVATLQDAVDQAQSDLDDANEQLQEYQDQLDEDNENLPTYKQTLTNAEYTANSIDKETQMYSWLAAEDARETAQSLVDDTEDEIDELEDEIEDQNKTISEKKVALEDANKAYELGVIEAAAERDTKLMHNETADEYESVSKASNSLTTKEALDDLNEAKEKLESFEKYIQNNEIIASENGVISGVSITAGDSLYSDSDIITVNDYDKVTITVDVGDDDLEYAQLGATAKVSIDAFPDTIFDAEVTDVGDATYDSSSGSTYYEITCTISGDDLSELYDGMTAEVTFVTKDSEDVLYIPNRAVTREDGKSYVKVKNESGKIETVEITTGFSDGTNVEVKEGLSEGDTVVIESQVDSE